MVFREMQVDVRTSDVMAGAGGGAGPSPDVRHQPEGTACRKCLSSDFIPCTVHAYPQRVHASGIAVEHTGWYARGPLFESEHVTQSSFFFFRVHTGMFLYVPGLSLYILACTRFVLIHTVQGFVTVCTKFVLVHTVQGLYLTFKVKA